MRVLGGGGRSELRGRERCNLMGGGGGGEVI